MLVIRDEEEIVTQYVETYVDWLGIVQDRRGKDEKPATFAFFAFSSVFY